MARKKKIDKEMGFRLKQARTEQKLTYEELAEKSGVSSRYIKEIENHGNVPSLEKLGQLIRALHISADPFFLSNCPGRQPRLPAAVGLSVTMYRRTDYNNSRYCGSLSSDI